MEKTSEIPIHGGLAVKWYEGRFKYIRWLATGRVFKFPLPEGVRVRIEDGKVVTYTDVS